MGVAANVLNKQSRTAEKEWSSSFGIRRGAKNSSALQRALELTEGPVADSCEHDNEHLIP
jgi:hypothetical protein